MTRSPMHLHRSLVTLLLGTGLAACLWLLGFGGIARMGFVAAAVSWPALDARPAAADAPTSMPLVDPTAGSYTLVPELSRIRLRVTKLRWLRVTATLSRLRGACELGEVGGRGELSVEAAVPVATFRSGNARRDVHVLQPVFLDARAHPWATYTLERGPWPTDRLTGRLTVRGTSHAVDWRLDAVRPGEHDGDLAVRASTAVSRTAFGVTGYRWLVGDRVEVTVDATVRPL